MGKRAGDRRILTSDQAADEAVEYVQPELRYRVVVLAQDLVEMIERHSGGHAFARGRMQREVIDLVHDLMHVRLRSKLPFRRRLPDGPGREFGQTYTGEFAQ